MDAETPKGGELSLPQAFLLLATDDKGGGPELPAFVLRVAVAGAVLAELDLSGAIELQGKRVMATGVAPQPEFQHQLDLIREKSRPHTPKRWVAMLESRAELHGLYEGMAAQGIVEHVGEKHLGLFTTTRYPEKDHGPEAALLRKVQAVLDGAPSDPRTTALTALLYAAGMLGRLFPGVEQSRARDLAKDHWPSRAVVDELRMVRMAQAENAT